MEFVAMLFEQSFCHVVIIFVILSGFVIENSNEYEDEVNENKIQLQSMEFSVEEVFPRSFIVQLDI